MERSFTEQQQNHSRLAALSTTAVNPKEPISLGQHIKLSALSPHPVMAGAEHGLQFRLLNETIVSPKRAVRAAFLPLFHTCNTFFFRQPLKKRLLGFLQESKCKNTGAAGYVMQCFRRDSPAFSRGTWENTSWSKLALSEKLVQLHLNPVLLDPQPFKHKLHTRLVADTTQNNQSN